MTAVFRMCAIPFADVKSTFCGEPLARPAFWLGRAAGTRGLLVLFVGLAFAVSGCGAKAKGPAPPAAAEADQKADEGEAKPAAKPEKKGVVIKLPEVVTRKIPEDPMKWQVADLQAGLSAQDGRFVPAVMFFSVQNLNGKKQAEDLKGLLVSAGKLKDDSSISLPLPPAPTAAPASVTASKPVGPTAPGTPGQPARAGRKRPGGRGFGGGLKTDN